MSVYVFDTHAFIWFLEGNEKLSADVRLRISNHESRLVLPTICLAEICWMIEKKKTALTLIEIQSAIDLDSRLIVQPLTQEIVFQAFRSISLTEMHDRLIAGTACYLQLSEPETFLLTSDQEIRAIPVIKTFW